MLDERQFCTFFVAELFLGIPVSAVQEVIRYQEMTSVPLADRTITGLINLRGQIVTAIDMRQRLGLEDRPPENLPMNVVIRTDDGAVSLLVDEIGDVLEVEERDFEPPLETLSGNIRELVQGVFKLETGLLLILDAEKTADISSTQSEALELVRENV